MTTHMKPAVGKKIKSISLAEGEKVYLGVDVHRRSYSVAVWSDQRGLIGTWTQPAEPALLVAKLSPFAAQVAWIVYEAGPTGYALVRVLRTAGFKADVIATSKMLKTTAREGKSDRVDCRRIAEHAAKGLLKIIRVPTEEEEHDRQVMRLREQMVRKMRLARQQIKSFLLVHGVAYEGSLKAWSEAGIKKMRELELPEALRTCLNVLLDAEQQAREQVMRLNQAVAKLMMTKRHKAKVRVLRSVPGVGPVTAMTFRTELVAPERFKEPGEIAKMIGLAPLVAESGDRRREGAISKAGNWRLRTILVEAAWRWVQKDEAARQVYRRFIRNTGDVKKAIVAMARKLAILLWRMVTREEMYRVRAAA